ncbi:hypothetical protein MTO96_019142 [Rhipicephalus appendiculatus]
MKLERAKVDAELEILRHEKEAAAAEVHAGALEAAVAQDGGESLHALPLLYPDQRTADYVQSQEAAPAPMHRHSELHTEDNAPRDDLNSRRNDGAHVHEHQTVQQGNQLSVNTPASSDASSDLTGILKFLSRRDLVSTSLTKFDDCPANFRAWKLSFGATTRCLELSAQEELDLLIAWLGQESSIQANRLKSVYIHDFEAGLKAVWKKLNDTFGSPEVVEDALMKRLEAFPRLSGKDNVKLRELGDLLLELEAAKADPYLAGLKYFDTARGVNSIVLKLPPGLQEKWMTAGSRYKKENDTAFPPFSFFSKFVRNEAEVRNDPSFFIRTNDALPDHHPKKGKQVPRNSCGGAVSARKTEADVIPEKNDTGPLSVSSVKESGGLKQVVSTPQETPFLRKLSCVRQEKLR